MPWPASIGLGGRLQPDSAAAFIGMRSLDPAKLESAHLAAVAAAREREPALA